MNTEKLEFKKSVFPQLLMVVILLIIAPYAMSFKPSVGPDIEGTRGWLIVTGMLLSLSSLIFCITTIHRGIVSSENYASLFSRGLQNSIVSASAVLAVFAIGWRCFPYWINGVYQMDLGASPWMDMDPKRLLPMSWMGDLWRLGVLLLALVTFIAVPILLLISIRLAVLKQRIQLFYTLVFCSIAITFHFLFQKHYMAWLLD